MIATKEREMKIIKSENVVMYDVDDTLVMWGNQWADEKFDYPGAVQIQCPFDSSVFYLRPHKPHIELLKTHKARRKTIIVWSQGGYKWAKAVVESLGLTKYVDIIMSKPMTYVDDLPVEKWMKNRIYLDPRSNWRTMSKEIHD